MILVKFSPVLLLFLNHLKYPLSLLNFPSLDSQYSMFIVLLPHLPRLFLSHSFSFTFKLLSHWQLPLLMNFLLLAISTFMLMIIKILRQINFYLSSWFSLLLFLIIEMDILLTLLLLLLTPPSPQNFLLSVITL